jgi:hypothetical protein
MHQVAFVARERLRAHYGRAGRSGYLPMVLLAAAAATVSAARGLRAAVTDIRVVASSAARHRHFYQRKEQPSCR